MVKRNYVWAFHNVILCSISVTCVTAYVLWHIVSRKYIIQLFARYWTTNFWKPCWFMYSRCTGWLSRNIRTFFKKCSGSILLSESTSRTFGWNSFQLSCDVLCGHIQQQQLWCVYCLVSVQFVGNLHSQLPWMLYISYLMETLCKLSQYPNILMMTVTII